MIQNRITPFEYKWLKACDHMASLFSTCSKRQYFSVILAGNRRVLGTGYNGSPPGYGHCIDGYCPRAEQKSNPGSIYDNCIANHAEANALLWSNPHDRKGGTLIVNGSPCFSCCKLICSSGISRVIGYDDVSYDQQGYVRNFFMDNGIDLVLTPKIVTSGDIQRDIDARALSGSLPRIFEATDFAGDHAGVLAGGPSGHATYSLSDTPTAVIPTIKPSDVRYS